MPARNPDDDRAARSAKGHQLITGVVSGLIVAFLAPVLLNWWHRDKWAIVDYVVVDACIFAVVALLVFLARRKAGRPASRR